MSRFIEALNAHKDEITLRTLPERVSSRSATPTPRRRRRQPPARKFDGGSLVNSVGIEAFAAVLLTISLRHKGRASLRLGVEPRPPSFP
jgi:hypothetical protein